MIVWLANSVERQHWGRWIAKFDRKAILRTRRHRTLSLDIDSIGAPRKIRTPDPQIRSLVLYPAELSALALHVLRCGALSIGGGRLWQGGNATFVEGNFHALPACQFRPVKSGERQYPQLCWTPGRERRHWPLQGPRRWRGPGLIHRARHCR